MPGFCREGNLAALEAGSIRSYLVSGHAGPRRAHLIGGFRFKATSRMAKTAAKLKRVGQRSLPSPPPSPNKLLGRERGSAN